MKSVETLASLGAEQYILKERIREAKKECNRDLRKEHKTLFRVFDIVIIFIILANVGAMVLTNILVIRQDPNVVLTEANPITAEIHDFVPSTDRYPKGLVFGNLIGFSITVVVYVLIIGFYLYTRFYSVVRKQLYQNMITMTFLGMAIFLDFFNNLGIYIGILIWGGIMVVVVVEEIGEGSFPEWAWIVVVTIVMLMTAMLAGFFASVVLAFFILFSIAYIMYD